MTTLETPFPSPYLVPFDGSFRIADAATEPPDDAPGKKDNGKALEDVVERLAELQAKLYAQDRHAVLLVFQAMDAAGKDGTIKAVMTGVNPAGCQVASFKAPTSDDLDHDFLWRCWKQLPERGRIGIFNRSHYEEVLVVKVKPQYLQSQRLPERPITLDELWAERYESIRDAERHWARNGTVVIKFFLHVSKKEQQERFLDRIDDAKANWKFSADDLKVRRDWDKYMAAYQQALCETSRPWAPWYVIPADSKSFMRRAVAEIVVGTLEELDLKYPPPPPLSPPPPPPFPPPPPRHLGRRPPRAPSRPPSPPHRAPVPPPRARRRGDRGRAPAELKRRTRRGVRGPSLAEQARSPRRVRRDAAPRSGPRRRSARPPRGDRAAGPRPPRFSAPPSPLRRAPLAQKPAVSLVAPAASGGLPAAALNVACAPVWVTSLFQWS